MALERGYQPLFATVDLVTYYSIKKDMMALSKFDYPEIERKGKKVLILATSYGNMGIEARSDHEKNTIKLFKTNRSKKPIMTFTDLY